MSIDGPLKSVYVVNDDELRVNDGRWLLQSGPAIKVRGFTESTLAGRKVKGGDALPVYVLGENDVRANGGRWLLKAGQPIPVTDVIGTARGVIQGKAIPVWPVDDDGNYDATFIGLSSYAVKILALNPIAYWPLWETSGLVAEDLINSPAQDGTYFNAALGQPGIGDGRTSAGFDGATTWIDVYSVALNAAFNGSAGTALIWAQVANVGVWTDAAVRKYFHLYVDGNNNIYSSKRSQVNQSEWRYRSGAANQLRTLAGFVDTSWSMFTITWDKAVDEVKPYHNATRLVTLNGLGIWAGNLRVDRTCIGCFAIGAPSENYFGNIAHFAVWDTALSEAQVATLAIV